jgi:hypothetical protein
VYEGLAPLLAQTFDQITVPGSGFIQYTGLRPDIVVTGQLVEEEPTGGGNWGGVRKSARRRPIRIKYSDFDTQEKYAAALAAAAMPIARVTDTGEMIAPAAPDLIHDYDDDDDVILKAVLLRVLEYAR